MDKDKLVHDMACYIMENGIKALMELVLKAIGKAGVSK